MLFLVSWHNKRRKIYVLFSKYCTNLRDKSLPQDGRANNENMHDLFLEWN